MIEVATGAENKTVQSLFSALFIRKECWEEYTYEQQ